MQFQDQDSLKSLISSCKQKVFALVLYLIGGDQDRAYDICAQSFAEAILTGYARKTEKAFIIRVITIAVGKSRATKTIPVCLEPELLDLAGAEKGPLVVLTKALGALDFDARALLLLRHQLNFFYREIAAVMRVSETNVRPKTAQAQVELRENIDKALNYK